MILKTLKTVVGFCGPNLGFEAKNVSTRYLRAAGAMALLCLVIDRNITKMTGRWRIDEMLRYLHGQAEPLMRKFSQLMLTHGNYSFLTHQ